mmetsp:Transcript_91907/g.297269  ORF Transcript_91907/g.297269 Transcript_91907/m.297269 type:complete len:261 (-) Transcript_91907:109-891(-)
MVILNVVSLVLRMLGSHKRLFFPHCFLMFYVVELGLKAVLYRSAFLCGNSFRAVAWNWLDVVIVLTGFLNFFATVRFQEAHDHVFVASTTGVCLALRLLQLSRACSLFEHWDVSWSEGSRFRAIMMLVIVMNSLCIALEDDYPRFPYWFVVEHAMLSTFLFELVVRLRLLGLKFFCAHEFAWNLFDFCIVVAGVFDMWFMPLFRSIVAARHVGGHGNLSKLMTCLRLIRMLRILRLVKLIKKIKPLYRLVVGIAESGSSC